MICKINIINNLDFALMPHNVALAVNFVYPLNTHLEQNI